MAFMMQLKAEKEFSSGVGWGTRGSWMSPA